MYYFGNHSEPPLPSKFCFKKKVPSKRNFLLGFIFFANVFPLAGKGTPKHCSTRDRRKGEEGGTVSTVPINIINILLKHFCKSKKANTAKKLSPECC